MDGETWYIQNSQPLILTDIDKPGDYNKSLHLTWWSPWQIEKQLRVVSYLKTLS